MGVLLDLERLPTPVLDRLRARAAAGGRTLVEETVVLLERWARSPSAGFASDAPGTDDPLVVYIPRDPAAPVVRVMPGGERQPLGPIITGDAPGDGS